MISTLIAYLSMDISHKLILAGVVAFSANVIGATNATPIVVTLDQPLPAALATRPFHGVVYGVAGNDAANGVWEFVPLTATTVAITGYSPQGQRFSAAGTGAWTSGGTLAVALPDGRALLGRRNVATYSTPPRIVFVPFGPVRWDFAPYGGIIPPATTPSDLAGITAEQQAMLLARQIATERQRFEIHVWGASNPPDPDGGDFDATQAIYSQVVQSMFSLCSGMEVQGGIWASQAESESAWTTAGQEYILQAAIDQPALDSQLQFVPSGTVGSFTVNFDNGATSDDVAFEVG